MDWCLNTTIPDVEKSDLYTVTDTVDIVTSSQDNHTNTSTRVDNTGGDVAPSTQIKMYR